MKLLIISVTLIFSPMIPSYIALSLTASGFEIYPNPIFQYFDMRFVAGNTIGGVTSILLFYPILLFFRKQKIKSWRAYILGGLGTGLIAGVMLLMVADGVILAHLIVANCIWAGLRWARQYDEPQTDGTPDAG